MNQENCTSAPGDNAKRPAKTGYELLEESAQSSQALDFALQTIMNTSAPNRGQAIRYLRLHFPDRLPGLLQAFAKDPDEELRYQLSEFLRDSDSDAAVAMKIGILRNATVLTGQRLILDIASYGNLSHLEALRGLANIAGPNSPFARAAQLLEERTRAEAAGAG